MNYFRRASLFIALGTAILLAGLKANAFPADNVAAAHTGDNRDTQQVTCIDYSKRVPVVYDEATIKAVVDYMNLGAPYDYGSGIVLSSVTLDQNVININNTCHPLVGLGLASATDAEIENCKQNAALILYQAMEQTELDDNGNSFLDVLASKNIAISYNYYVRGSSTPACTIKITAEYIERVGDIQKNGYSI